MRVAQVIGFAVILLPHAIDSHAQRTPAPLELKESAASVPWARYPGWTRNTWDAYNDLARRDRTPPPAKSSLARDASIAGNPEKGRELAFSRTRGGGCVACHVMGSATPETPGDVGPDLSTIGAAQRSDAYLFDYIDDPRRLNPATVMPPWGAHALYSADEIRDMVAFLRTLTSPAALRGPLEDPQRRRKPVEDRDALDPFVNPGIERVPAGEALFVAPGPNGEACIACHAAPRKAFAEWAATLPRWEPRLGKVLGVEEFVFRHARATTGARYAMGGEENVNLSVYLHFLANGRPIRVDTSSAPAREAMRAGESLYRTKIGQLNFSCSDCHDAGKGANKWIRGQYLGESRGQLDHYPAWRTSRNEIWDIRKRFQWCNLQVRANDLPPDAPEYGALELFLKAQSQGLPLAAPNIRH
ncbi:sulfur oxidation c-type cytochrome SoxX [Betaproteobacteria bacterium GR16-43]|nr:sulfur oxidation c-type cytochrome SoxX [Betaproteobacteria bacterium GR16-43]